MMQNPIQRKNTNTRSSFISPILLLSSSFFPTRSHVAGKTWSNGDRYLRVLDPNVTHVFALGARVHKLPLRSVFMISTHFCSGLLLGGIGRDEFSPDIFVSLRVVSISRKSVFQDAVEFPPKSSAIPFTLEFNQSSKIPSCTHCTQCFVLSTIFPCSD